MPIRTDGRIYFRSNAHERRQDRLSRIRPERYRTVDYVKLEWMDMLFVFLIPCRPVRQNIVDPNVIPKGRGVLTPNPMTVTVLNLVSFVASVFQQVRRNLAGPRVVKKPGRMLDRNRIRPLAAKDEEIGRLRNGAS